MFKTLSNLTKAAIGVAVTPIDAVIDIVTLPESAYDDTDPFARTKKRLKQAGEAFDEAVKPESE
jgi:hypothetical protein